MCSAVCAVGVVRFQDIDLCDENSELVVGAFDRDGRGVDHTDRLTFLGRVVTWDKDFESTELADTELANTELADFARGHRTWCENTADRFDVFCILPL